MFARFTARGGPRREEEGRGANAKGSHTYVTPASSSPSPCPTFHSPPPHHPVIRQPLTAEVANGWHNINTVKHFFEWGNAVLPVTYKFVDRGLKNQFFFISEGSEGGSLDKG